MTTQTVTLFGRQGEVIATAQVNQKGECYGGTIDLSVTPAHARALFDEFEDVVNSQMFSFLDDVRSKIRALGITVAVSNGPDGPVEDLQVFPSVGEVSFKLATPKTPPIINSHADAVRPPVGEALSDGRSV